MVTVLVHHQVNNYPAWKNVFDASAGWRQSNGESTCRVFHAADNVNDVTLLFEWDNAEKAHQFLASDELRKRMADAGVKGQPEVQYLTEMHTVRRSAAD